VFQDVWFHDKIELTRDNDSLCQASAVLNIVPSAPHGGNMIEPTYALRLQLLEWIAEHPRRYEEALEAWRTTCPRLSIWEDACIDGLIDCEAGSRLVSVSAKGKLLLQNRSH
jgi:hypothetical protein